MPTIMAHALATVTIGMGSRNPEKSYGFYALLAACAMAPDLDVVGFYFHIPYDSFWGHRGFSHSLAFAGALGLTIGLTVYGHLGLFRRRWWIRTFQLSLATASHGLLDGCTNGGHGVAYFAPLDNARYFFPWRPIQVSPIGLKNFLTAEGLQVLLSELLFIGIPVALFCAWRFRRHKL